MSSRQSVNWPSLRSGPRLWRRLRGLLYYDRYPDLRRTSLVAGTARSGTTWLAELIAAQISGRIIFEPFNPDRIDVYRRFHYHYYLRSEERQEALAEYCQRIFSGKIRHPWLDRDVKPLFPQHRVVKAVRASLLLDWLYLRFPEVSQLLIIRHPCAVFLSWQRLGWRADKDIAAFLNQPELIADFLHDKLDCFHQAESEEEKMALVWCVTNLVPLSQNRDRKLHVVFYEGLVTQPELEVPRAFAALNLPYRESALAHLIRPSMTTVAKSGQTSGRDQVSRWQRELSATQIDRILGVVEAFGLDRLYGDDFLPLPQ